jgi:hypothetical protein
MTRTRKFVLGSAFLAIWALGAVVIAWIAAGVAPNNAPENITIEAGYALDATDIDVVTANTDQIFVGRVLSIVETNRERATTKYAVEVHKAIKGSPSAIEEVEQYGLLDEEVSIELADQPRLEVGKTYFLATTVDESGNNFVVAGPVAAQPRADRDEN